MFELAMTQSAQCKEADSIMQLAKSSLHYMKLSA